MTDENAGHDRPTAEGNELEGTWWAAPATPAPATPAPATPAPDAQEPAHDAPTYPAPPALAPPPLTTASSSASASASAVNASTPAGTPTAVPLAGSESVAQIAKALLPSVVSIIVSSGTSGDEGTGIVLTADGDILTNNHVVESA